MKEWVRSVAGPKKRSARVSAGGGCGETQLQTCVPVGRRRADDPPSGVSLELELSMPGRRGGTPDSAMVVGTVRPKRWSFTAAPFR